MLTPHFGVKVVQAPMNVLFTQHVTILLKLSGVSCSDFDHSTSCCVLLIDFDFEADGVPSTKQEYAILKR